MFDTLPTGLREAAKLTGAGRLADATAAIQRLLGGQAGAPAPGTRTIDGVAERLGTPAPGTAAPRRAGGRAKLSDLVRAKAAPPAAVSVPPGARFLAGTFGNAAGSRAYKLYVPSGYHAGQPVPLVVMLHGCTQSPDDFAVGTRMNEAAERDCFLVAYPAQAGSANVQRCWNWFSAADQARDAGEPSLVAGITRQVMAEFAVDPRRVYAAGLSAGGAAAAVLGAAYPDLYAAIGVHSGLAHGAARDMPSAFAAMRQGAPGLPARGGAVPAIVFHGDGDTAVHPSNGDAVAAQAAGRAALRVQAAQGRAPGGHAYTRTVRTDAAGRAVTEQWVIHGAPHAWAGGSADGSYTDPRGPDATREMVRFFLEHPKR